MTLIRTLVSLPEGVLEIRMRRDKIFKLGLMDSTYAPLKQESIVDSSKTPERAVSASGPGNALIARETLLQPTYKQIALAYVHVICAAYCCIHQQTQEFPIVCHSHVTQSYS